MIRTSVILLFVISGAVLLNGCGVTQPVRTVPEGTTQLTGSFGGAVIPFAGIAIPVPYLTTGALYGYSNDLTVFGSAHLTAILFKNAGLDLGASYRAVKEQSLVPELTVTGKGYFFWDAVRGSTKRLYPSMTVTASYSAAERSLLYFGAEGLYQQSNSELFIAPFAGYSFAVHPSMIMLVETKWLAANKDTRHGIFEGAGSIGGRGNIGIYCGVQWEAFQ